VASIVGGLTEHRYFSSSGTVNGSSKFRNKVGRLALGGLVRKRQIFLLCNLHVDIIRIFRIFRCIGPCKGLQRLAEELGVCGFYRTVGSLQLYEVMDDIVFKCREREFLEK